MDRNYIFSTSLNFFFRPMAFTAIISEPLLNTTIEFFCLLNVNSCAVFTSVSMVDASLVGFVLLFLFFNEFCTLYFVKDVSYDC